MDFDKERLMMSEDEVRERARELLNENQVDLITKYMFLEQKLQKQKEIIDKIYELIKQHIRKDGFLELNEWQTRDLLDILKEVEVNALEGILNE